MEIVPGDLVEVTSNQDGYLGSYFLAKLLDYYNDNTVRVEYMTLYESAKGKERRKETVEAYQIRPNPPEIRVSGFNVMDIVDVRYAGGWWVGRVTGRFGQFYSVYFDSTDEEIEYNVSKLRLHQEFVNGQWQPSQIKNII